MNRPTIHRLRNQACQECGAVGICTIVDGENLCGECAYKAIQDAKNTTNNYTDDTAHRLWG